MVDVRMCDQYIVDRAWRKGQGTVVFVSCALLQAAVNQDALVTNFQAMAAAGDRFICAKKRKVSSVPSCKFFNQYVYALYGFDEIKRTSSCPDLALVYERHWLAANILCFPIPV